MANFKLVSQYQGGKPMRTLEKASATVILPGDLVAIASGLAIKGTAATTAHAFCPNWAIAGELTVQVLDDANAEFTCTGASNFAVAQRGVSYDMAVSGASQTLNQAATTTTVLKVVPGTNAGTVGSTANIRVKIAKFLG